MKQYLITIILMVMLVSTGWANSIEDAHKQMIYPCVRVSTANAGGSGTIIYSKKLDNKYSTYALTNYHVVADAISVVEEWDSDLQKDIKVEKRGLIHIEIFKYKNTSIPIGTLKVEAEIALYNQTEDMALVKLSTEDQAKHIAKLLPRDKIKNLRVMNKTLAVGCSLGYPPLPSEGIITRLNMPVESLPYHMSQSNIIYGNSGGAMYLLETAELIGIPSLVPVVGWGAVVSHMGLFIPIERTYDWLEEEHYNFIFDDTKTEKECLEKREEELEKKKEQQSR